MRGVGGGLPLARDLMAAAGGRLELADNLGGGAAVTLRPRRPAPRRRPPPSRPAPRPPARSSPCSSRSVRATPEPASPSELGRSRAECGRELALLQHRGLVVREPGGARRLTDAGAALVATLF